ncbi:MAG: calcium-binding protein [Salipiger marinus]|uniref:calcium-binding protein n=1 Tax=Salipiger marinus TaxID=555512 RepID=UPI004059012F
MPKTLITLEPFVTNTFDPTDGLIDLDYEVHGGTKNDSIKTLDGNDLAYGGAGNDSIWSLSGSDTFYGGAGDDRIWQSSHKLLVYRKLVAHGEEGNDTISGADGDDKLYGGADNDDLYGSWGANYLSGGTGNDTIWGGADALADTMVGGTGDDVFVFTGDFQSDKIYEDPAGGHDTLYVQPGAHLTLADYVEDLIVAAPGSAYNTGQVSQYFSSVLTGNAMANTISSLAGWDTLKGGAGNDSLSAGAGHDVLYGGADNDLLLGQEGKDTLYGESGHDTLQGGSGEDRLYGGTDGDTLSGGTDNDTLWGEDGDDLLDGNEGTDVLYGGAGHDRLTGSGKDLLQGGLGNDTYHVDSTAQILESLNSGTDTVITKATSLSLAANVENLTFDTASHHTGTGNAGANVIEDTGLSGPAKANSTFYGLGGNDTLNGGDGSDKLYGGGDHDTLRGEEGSDRLEGGAGNDLLYGGEGDDLLAGGAGQDKLYGGEGADRFVFYTASDSAGATYDKLVGFDFGADRIDLSSIDANSLLAGNQAFSFSVDKPFFTSAGDLWTELGGAGIKILGDTNGDGVADFQLVVYGIGNPYEVDFEAADFIL